MKDKVLLLILDGWGIRKSKKGNVISSAKTPVMNKLWKTQVHSLLQASGPAVGLPNGCMANSEVGHLTIGAGRVTDSDLVRIIKSIKNKSFFKNKALIETVNHVKKNKTR